MVRFSIVCVSLLLVACGNSSSTVTVPTLPRPTPTAQTQLDDNACLAYSAANGMPRGVPPFQTNKSITSDEVHQIYTASCLIAYYWPTPPSSTAVYLTPFIAFEHGCPLLIVPPGRQIISQVYVAQQGNQILAETEPWPPGPHQVCVPMWIVWG